MLPKLLTSWLPVSKKSHRRHHGTRLGIEYLEDRTMLNASLPPDIVLGRTLSAYAVAGVQNHTMDITYTVYNEDADEVTGVLLTTTLQPGVTFKAASTLPDQSGQNLAWSLGTIHGFDRASVTLTITLPDAPPLQLDSGAQAFATVDGAMATADTPAAAMVNRSIPADQLVSTPDANTTDPYVQEEAAKLRYDPQAIFDFLHSQVGYNSYLGSLRGARGTLWSNAGNSLDVASLGVALMRASGIPAQYESGTLSKAQAQQLILSMFPASYQTVGYIPAGTQTADPANDSQLLTETESHYWLQFDTGQGMQNADPLMVEAAIGQSFTAATGSFTEVPDALREKIEVSLTAEIYSQATAGLGLGDGLGQTVVLDHTFNDVDLVGRPLTIGNFIDQSPVSALTFSTNTTTYTPYMVIGDEALPDDQLPEAIIGTQYQEVSTNFPLGNQTLTGLFLHITLNGPAGLPETYDRTLVDRIGYAARQGFESTSVSVDPTGGPILREDDIWTINALPGLEQHSPSAKLSADIASEQAELTAIQQSGASAPNETSIERQLAIDLTRQIGINFAKVSDFMTARSAVISNVAAYFDRPRLVITSSHVVVNGQTADVTLAIDLRRETIRAIAVPGQNPGVAFTFNVSRGMTESATEDAVLNPSTGAGTPTANTAEVIRAAQDQSIPLIAITVANLVMVDDLDIPDEAKARITSAIQQGKMVVVPSRGVDLGGTTTTAWFEIDPNTGETIGVTQDGGHQGLIEFIGRITAVGIGIGIYVALAAQGGQGGKPFTPQQIKDMKADIEKFGSSFRGAILSLVSGGLAFGIEVGFFAVLWVEGLLAGVDPTLSGLTADIQVQPVLASNSSTLQLPTSSAVPAGALAGTAQMSTVAASGQLAASWNSADYSGFQVLSLNSSSATIVDGNGATVGTGPVSLTQAVPVAARIRGNNQYRVTGTGNLSFYGPAESSLGVSGNWDSYTANVTGTVSITLTTDGLTLNGNTTLPAGTYTITTSAATLSGSGNTSSPNFAGSASVSATNGTINLGTGSGNVTVGGHSLDTTNGATLAGYSGSITVSSGGSSSNPDSVTLNGTAANVLTLSTTPASVTADQNTPATFQANVNTSLADTYTLTAQALPGWTVVFDATGKVTVTPAPGTQVGAFPVRLIGVSSKNANLVAQDTVMVTVTSTAPGITFAITPDTQITVPAANGAQVPTAFRARIDNIGPAADTYNLSFSNVPAGFTILNSGTTVTVPAGQTGILGVYLQATGALPAPGTPLSFTVTATSTTNPAITRTVTVSLTMPAAHGVTVTAAPAVVGTTPGTPAAVALTLTAVGNVPESVTLTSVLSAGLTATGLPPTVSLNPGQSTTLHLTLTPGGSVSLNTILGATITAAFNPLGSAFDQTVQIPVNVVIPGADASVNAAAAATQLGNADLANRLNDLATAVTNLYQNPGDAVDLSQVLAALDALTGLLSADPLVAPLVPPLAADRNALASATTQAEVGTAVIALGNDLTPIEQVLADEAAHRFTLSLSPDTETAQPQTPISFPMLIQNNGNQTTTYDLSVSGLPPGVTGSFTSPTVTLAPGQSTAHLTTSTMFLTVEQTSASEVQPFSFQVTATAEGASEITATTTGSFAARDEIVQVVAVTPSTPAANPGDQVGFSAQILNAVNRQQVAEVSYTVTDASGAVVYQSQAKPVTLNVLTTLSTVNLGILDTTGFADGVDTISVTVADATGNPISGATGTGTLVIGPSLTATLGSSPPTLTASSGVVTTTFTITAMTDQQSVTAVVTVPTANGAATDFNTFSLDPDQVTPGTDTDVLEWDLGPLAAGTTETITWHTNVDGLQPGQALTVVDGATVTYDGTPGTVGVVSGPATLAAALGVGALPMSVQQQLDDGDTTGLTFAPALVGAFDSFTQPPAGSPTGTRVVNIPPGDGESGFYEMTFTLPAGSSNPQLTGAANVDDTGRIFLNGHPLTPSIFSDPATPGLVNENNDATFSTTDPSFFQAGVNTLLVADTNVVHSGPSAAAFYATATYTPPTGSGSGANATLTLPAQIVTRDQVIGLSPPTRTVAAGLATSYTVTVSNPSAAPDTFDLGVSSLPGGWVNLPAQVTVGAGGSTTLTLTVTPDAATLAGDYAFTVTADDGAGVGFAAGDLIVTSPPPVADPAAHGVVAALTPAQATAGQGTAATFTVRVINTGSSTETFTLSAAGLPAGVNAVFAQPTVTVPAGASNFHDVTLTVTPSAGATVGSDPFTVSAASTTSAATDTADGTLLVSAAGVSITLNKSTGSPGDTFQAIVTNTGTAAGTIDLSAAGPAGLVATLGTTQVTLGPGQSQMVPITTTAAPFAIQGPLTLIATATAHSNAAVKDAASAHLQVAPSAGLTASFTPPAKTLSAAGNADFLLNVNNTGNTEDSYSTTITGTTGSITAVLVGLDGSSLQSVPLFRLPGLSTGAILLHTTAAATGTGSVTVTVRSLTNNAIVATATATLAVTSVQAPMATSQSVSTEAATTKTITLAGTDPNSPALPLTFAIVTPPAHGTLSAIAGNTVTYTPAAGFSGTDSFSFKVNNGSFDSAPATASISVQQPVLLGYHEFGVGADNGYPAVARFFNPDGSERYTKTVFPGLNGGVRVTSADFNHDGVADLVAGTGPGSITSVVIFDGVTGNVLFSIQPFEDRFVGGVFVAAGDLTGDGVPDLVITPDVSGGPRVRVFSGAGFGIIADFYGIDDPAFRGGARAGIGDVNGDGAGDLVVSAGFGGGPRIAIFDGRALGQQQITRITPDFFLFEDTLRNGAYVAAGDLNGDGYADVIGGGGPGGGPRVLALSGQDLQSGPASQAHVVANFFGGDVNNRGGIRVVARDLDGDRRADLVVGDGSGAGSRVTGYLGKNVTANGTPPEAFAFDAYPGFTGGVYVG